MDRTIQPGDLALAVAHPASETAWQRQCEIAERSMTQYLMERCRSGHSAHAQLYGGIIALASYAKALVTEDGRAPTAEYMIDAIKAVMLGDEAAAPATNKNPDHG